MYGINTLPYYTESEMTPYGYASGGIANTRQGYLFGGISKKISKIIPKEISSTLDKIIPNEIKPVLPYVAAAVPFMGAMGAFGSLTGTQLAALSMAANAGSQMSQEGYDKRGLNALSLGLSGLGGYLSAPGAVDAIGGNQIIGNLGDKAITAADLSNYGTSLSSNVGPEAIRGLSLTPGSDLYNTLGGVPIENPTLLQQAQNVGNTALQYGAKQLEVLPGQDLISTRSAAQLSVPMVGAASEQAYNSALDAQLKYQDQQAALGQTASANRQNQIDYIRKAMQTAGFTSPEIDDALKRSGFAYGGRAGYGLGGDVIKGIKRMKGKVTDYLSKLTDDIKIYPQTDYADDVGASFDLTIVPKTKKGKSTLDKLVDQGYVDKHSDGSYFMHEGNLDEGTTLLNDYGIKASGVYEPHYKKGHQFESFRSGAGLSEYAEPYYGYDVLREGLYNRPRRSPMSGAADLDTIPTPPEKFADGGLMSLGGNEMDFRASGGFVPIGKKERADDVPARLSKNEFVFTAKAVRNAGGGDIKEGAKRMYQIMRQLEAKA